MIKNLWQAVKCAPLSQKILTGVYAGGVIATGVLGGVLVGWASETTVEREAVTVQAQAVVEDTARREYFAFEQLDLSGVSLQVDGVTVTQENGLSASADLSSAGYKEVSLTYKKDDYTTYVASYPVEVFFAKHYSVEVRPTVTFHADGEDVSNFTVWAELSGKPTEFSVPAEHPDWENVAVIPAHLIARTRDKVEESKDGHTFTTDILTFTFSTFKYTVTNTTVEYADGVWKTLEFENITPTFEYDKDNTQAMFLAVENPERYDGDGANEGSMAKGTYYYVDMEGKVTSHGFRYYLDGEKDHFVSGSLDGYSTFIDWNSGTDPNNTDEANDGECDLRVTNAYKVFRVSKPWRDTLLHLEATDVELKGTPVQTEFFVGDFFKTAALRLLVNGEEIGEDQLTVYADTQSGMADGDTRKARIAYLAEDGTVYKHDVDIKVLGFKSIDFKACEGVKENGEYVLDENGYKTIDNSITDKTKFYVWAQLTGTSTKFSNVPEQPTWTDVFDITSVVKGKFLVNSQTVDGYTFDTRYYDVTIDGVPVFVDQSTAEPVSSAWRSMRFENTSGGRERLYLALNTSETNGDDGDSLDTRATGTYYFVNAKGEVSSYAFSYYLTNGVSMFVSNTLEGENQKLIKEEQAGGVAEQTDMRVTIDGVTFQVADKWREFLLN